MRQRLDDPVFQFTNSTIGANSVATVLANTTLTTVSTGVYFFANSAAWTNIVTAVNKLSEQLYLMGIIRSS